MNIKTISVLMARIALSIIYIWFGILKVFGQSPASPMVKSLLSHTMPFMPFPTFIVLFGLFEVIIGILFILPGWERSAFILFTVHMVTTTMPLFILPGFIWTHPFVPTLEGQYIVKNLALIACALSIAASLPKKQEDILKNVI